jgi:hypothetical protein
VSRRLALVLLPLLLITAACGNDDGGGSGSSDTTDAKSDTTAAKADSAKDTALAEAVVLKLSDFPSGYTEGEPPSKDDEEEDPFGDCLSSDAKALDEDTTGEAESPDFSRGETTTVSSFATVFNSESSAEKAMDVVASDELKECFDRFVTEEIKANAGDTEGVTFGDVELKDTSFPDTGEETNALQFVIPISAAGTDITFYVDLVFFRQDRTVAGLFLGDLGKPFPSADAATLAKKMAGRMQAA